MKNTALIYAFMLLCSAVFAQKQVKTLQAPAENQKSVIYTEGVSILPSGRFVTPVGKVTRITRGAFGLAIAPDEKRALALHHNGVVTQTRELWVNSENHLPHFGRALRQSIQLNCDAFRRFLYRKSQF